MKSHRHQWSKPVTLGKMTFRNCSSTTGGILLCFCLLVKVGRGKKAKWQPQFLMRI